MTKLLRRLLFLIYLITQLLITFSIVVGQAMLDKKTSRLDIFFNEWFVLGLMPSQTLHQIFFLFYCEEKREPVLSVSACVEQDEQDNTTIAPFQIFDLSGAKYQLVIPYLIRNLSMSVQLSL